MLQSIVHVCLAGLSAGMFIWLVASGLTLIFGVLRVLNFAHGSFYMLGAYFCYTFLRFMGENFWLGLLVGPLCVCAAGFVMERFFLRYVYHIALPYQLLLTFAFVLLFDDLVKIFWGAGSIGSPAVAGLSGSVSVLGRNFSVYSLFIIGVGPLIALAMWVFWKEHGGAVSSGPLHPTGRWPLP
jgi:branched-chain amino acid transport system permease protein